jgi:hypothetical protein
MSKHGEFSGEPETRWLTEPNDPDRRMNLLRDFTFTDPEGKAWEVPAGYDKMDGASIPRALWTLVGSPYTGDYRRASIVHDRACDEARGDKDKRRAADRMFYHACRAGGCSVRQAAILYIGVRIGAALPDVAPWRLATLDNDSGPRLYTTADEDRLVGDFRVVAERVLDEGETDDPLVLEARTTGALVLVTGLDTTRLH